ncbi:MAG TPA: UDPGP type 1 family protein [Gemmataceae bacterium]|nr:UDPGP type 1 family protein [Gemmataceae bacterium]
MLAIPDDLMRRIKSARQEHVLRRWDRLSDAERRELLSQLQALDLEHLDRLYAERDHAYKPPSWDAIKPVPVVPADSPDNRRCRRIGEEALRRGEVAVLVVAGGQGTRLGFDQPKGMFPIGPVTNKSLFQIHAEKVLATRRRYGAAAPFLLMTSQATDAPTREFFAKNGYFGLPKEEVHFFRQGTMPALDLATGKLLMEAPGRLFLSPDGHGGTLTALASSGLLARLREKGVRHLFYFQVDNPLVKVADPTFLGRHIEKRSQASSRVIPKLGPTDKLGNFVEIDGRCSMIEYSDLPLKMAEETDETGKLRLWAGSPAIHYFDVEFLAQATAGRGRLPFHVARKKAPYLDESGRMAQPEKENALKFERFIFDVLPLAERYVVVETSRREEFAPLKNATGADSPEAVKQAISDLAGDWLEAAGVSLPKKPDGGAAVALEVGPLFALDREEFVAKVDRNTRIDGPRHFG